jgi:hypothetical protein
MIMLAAMLTLAGSAFVQSRTGSANHIGCAETWLRPYEQLILPRALWCSEDRCWNNGEVELPVHELECESEDACLVKVYCQARLSNIGYAIATTVGGFIGILAFVCAPHSRYVDVKYHKQ